MVREIPLNEIVDNPFQPRTTFDRAAIQSLADEIRAEGFWNTTLQGRRTKNGKVELVFGHRRLRALRLLKLDAIKIEIVELTDAQMAMRSLEENLQREGLKDLERSDAVKRAVELARAERAAAGKSDRGVINEIADRLGIDQAWVSTLCEISMVMTIKERAAIEAGHLTAQTALRAKQWGGNDYVQTLAKQGKQAKDGTVPKPTHMTVAAMKKAVIEAPEPVREKLKEAIVTGKVTTPADAERKARRLASSHASRQKQAPPDLREVIVGMTHDIKDFDQKLQQVAPYMDYVEEVPVIAERFRVALRGLIETAKQLL